MKRVDSLFEELQKGILNGKYGKSGAKFFDARGFAREFRCSLRVAVELFHKLEGVNLLRLHGKQYYVTTGYCSPTSPYGAELAKSGEKIYGVLVNDTANPFLGELINCLSEVLNKDSARLIISSSNGDQTIEEDIMEMFLRHRCKGVFICVQIPTSRRAYYERYPLPLVTLADYADFTNSDMVLVDNYLAGKQVAKHLIDCGCKSFAYVTAENYIEFDRRLEGYRDYLADNGFGLPDESIGVMAATDKGTQSRTLSWFVNNMLNEVAANKDLLPLGIFCFHDLIAVDVHRDVKNYRSKKMPKLIIPDDIMIVGFDNLPVSAHVTPQLTTVSYQCFNIASKAYSIMLDYVNNPKHKTGVYEVPFALTIRETTKKCEDEG